LKTNTVTFTNTTIDDGLLYPYFVTDGMRIKSVDNFSFTPPVVLYDFPQGGVAVNMPSSPAGNTLQFTAGNANIATGTPSTALNPAFTPSFTQFLTLVGAGPWTFVINTTYDWIWVVGHPVAYAGPGTISITHPASKDATIEIQGGSGENPTLPVELSSFTAVLNTEYFVNLAWVTQSETDLNGFVIYRSETDDLTQACIVSGIIPATNSSTEATYSFSDTEVENNTTYYYWLNSVELSGNGDFHGPVQITVNHNDGEVPPPEIPFSSGIKKVFPNPFNPHTEIAYSLSKKANTEIAVYNNKGQLIRKLVSATKDSGLYRVGWDGKDNNGRSVSGGIYFVRMTADHNQYIQKVTLLK
jgi:hypothetical protein